jgi:8-oxo-dGTP pyrophosphatase MutT (NUDIX family)
MDSLDKAIVAELPVLIKALPMGTDGRRLVEVEASCEDVDYDGDVILQSALLGSAEHFKAIGTLDIDHLSEIGHRLNPPIQDPSSYIVGRPVDVKKLPGNRTSVVGEIRKSRDGTVNPAVNRYDELWLSFQSEPPVQWYSSVFGYLRSFDDCSTGTCGTSGAKRYLVKEFEWKSLAFTRRPKNTGLKGEARIISAKSFMGDYALEKGMTVSDEPEVSTIRCRAAGILILTGEPGAQRMLMLKRSSQGDHPGEWAFPGGKIEAGETPQQAAVRETQEETGYPVMGPLNDLTQRIANGVDFTTYLYHCTEMFKPILDDEHSDWMWASVEDPPWPMHPGCVSTLNKLREMMAKSTIVKDMIGSDPFAGATSMQDLAGMGKCAGCGVDQYPSLLGYRQHFQKCLSLPPGQSDIYSYALMHRHNMDKSFVSGAGRDGNVSPAV